MAILAYPSLSLLRSLVSNAFSSGVDCHLISSIPSTSNSHTFARISPCILSDCPQFALLDVHGQLRLLPLQRYLFM
ncbi:uncharacterized protein EI90DRAFT_3079099 [Cantharellus anzutake]|uniref:uncharacterized protein n=1 Tax=Cantharellus anzutake TaxID=1750568 RepID=UPI001907070D|nr:uncharacterized protein EI90DRAFT_3079099 [Cantharellus anzutake]KAF8321467.1 hypothetical protein EI90DRAFT_3079099 [Cantharellus anzutake]